MPFPCPVARVCAFLQKIEHNIHSETMVSYVFSMQSPEKIVAFELV